jgi:CRP/FNR family transcriptional regulator
MIEDPAVQARINERFPLLGRDAAFRAGFFRCATAGRVPAGRHICHEGDECTQLALLVSGRVRVFKLAESGREITLYCIEAGDSCVLTASCIMSAMRFPALAVSETSLEAVMVPAKRVQTWMACSQVWRDLIFGLISRRLATVIAMVEDVAFRRTDARVTAYLYRLRGPDGDALNPTHQEIAAELGRLHDAPGHADGLPWRDVVDALGVHDPIRAPVTADDDEVACLDAGARAGICSRPDVVVVSRARPHPYPHDL